MSEVEGIVILGMHRSGTSLITRLVSLVGASICRDDDVLVGRTGNPRGHWESRSMNAFNDELLTELDATWYCPPRVTDEVARSLVQRHGDRALATLRAAHPSRPFAWKDPRTSVLLPFWSSVLRGRVAYVVAVRHPLEVGDSLASRNGFTPLLSLSLWERYTREALLGAAGSPLMMSPYDEVLADPVGWCERLAGFLGDLGLRAQPDREAIGGFVSAELRHSSHAWSELESDPRLSAAQLALAHAVTVPVQAVSYVPPELPAETPDTEHAFAGMRNRAAIATAVAPLPELGPALVDPSLRAGRLGSSAPALSAVVVGERAARDRMTTALAQALPPGAELIVAGGPPPPGAARHVEVPEPAGPGLSLALGARAATGRIVVLCTQPVAGLDAGVFDRWSDLLTRRHVVAVAPVLVRGSSGSRGTFGRRFADADLALAGADRAGTDDVVPLLDEAFLLVNREVLTTSGGLDEHFDTAAAAIAELSLRLWRMGFPCRVTAPVRLEVTGLQGSPTLHDRLRIAALHLDAIALEAFQERQRSQPEYAAAHARVQAGGVAAQRAAIEPACAFSTRQYFDAFPTRFPFAKAVLRRTWRAFGRLLRTGDRISSKR
jgi:hypothetical protein